jgi:hypothetical protein
MTSIVTLCCSSEWQWVPLDDDARNLPMADVDGARAFLRVVLLSSFGNPYRYSGTHVNTRLDAFNFSRISFVPFPLTSYI